MGSDEPTAADRVPCPIRGHDEWFASNDGKPITFLSFEATNEPRVRVVALGCQNCRFLRFHAA